METWEYCDVYIWDEHLLAVYRTPSGTKREHHKIQTQDEKMELKQWQSDIPKDWPAPNHWAIGKRGSVYLSEKLITRLLASGWEMWVGELNVFRFRRKYYPTP